MPEVFLHPIALRAFLRDQRRCAFGIAPALRRCVSGQEWHQALVGPDTSAPVLQPRRTPCRSRRMQRLVASVRRPTISVR
jgi:hypothetical protein